MQGNYQNKEYEGDFREQKERKGSGSFIDYAVISLSLIGASLFFVGYSSKSVREAVEPVEELKILRETSSSNPSWWGIYKHTTSITPGTYDTVATFVDTYITNVQEAYDLGCNESFKVVGALASATDAESAYTFSQIHWVDSSTFETTGLSIESWADYVYGLDVSEFNPFQQNKVDSLKLKISILMS